MMRSLRASASRTHFSAPAGPPAPSRISGTFSLAPPCSGPLRAPMAATTAECRSDSVEQATRAVNVDALNSCSA